MIEKFARYPECVKGEPAFTTENFAVFHLRTPWEFEWDPYVEIFDMYLAFGRKREYYRPDCIVWVDHERSNNGDVINRVVRCSVYPMNVDACLEKRTQDSNAAERKSKNLSIAVEVLRGIREFAGPLGRETLLQVGAYYEEVVVDYDEICDQLQDDPQSEASNENQTSDEARRPQASG